MSSMHPRSSPYSAPTAPSPPTPPALIDRSDPGWHSCAQNIKTCNTSQIQVLNDYHAQFARKLDPVIDPATPHGGYMDSCMAHCQSGAMQPPMAALGNRTSMAAISDWYDGQDGGDKMLFKKLDAPYPNGVTGCCC